MGRFAGWRWRWGGTDKLELFPVTISSAHLPVSASPPSLCHQQLQPTPTPHLSPGVPQLSVSFPSSTNSNAIITYCLGAKLALEYSKGTHFLSMQQTLLCALQVTPKAVQSPQSLQVSLGPVTSAWVNPAALCNRKGLAPQTWCTNWEIHKNFKRSEAQPFSPHQRRAAKIWKTSLLTPPGTRVAMDTTSPAWCFFCPLVLKLLCSSVLTHAGKEDFSPHLPKTSPQNTKSIWGLRAGRAHCAPFLLLNHWFLSNSFVHKASCVFINVRVYASTIVHLKSMYLHTHAVHLGLKKGDQEAN